MTMTEKETNPYELVRSVVVLGLLIAFVVLSFTGTLKPLLEPLLGRFGIYILIAIGGFFALTMAVAVITLVAVGVVGFITDHEWRMSAIRGFATHVASRGNWAARLRSTVARARDRPPTPPGADSHRRGRTGAAACC